MRRVLFLAVARLLFTPVGLRSQDIACTPTVPLAKQHRTNLKHRAPADSTVAVNNATVAQVLHWSAPNGISDPTTRKSNQPISPRESEVNTLTGDLWRVIVEDNDCDFHLELTMPGQPKTASRIIVEVPQGDALLPAREKLIEELTANGYSIGLAKSIPLDEPLRVTVTGYAFYDSAHYSKNNPKKGHNHGTQFVGTLWELHPVWEIKFADTQ